MITFVVGDLTTQRVDAIVNAANVDDPEQKIARPRQIYTWRAHARLRADGQALTACAIA